MTSPIRVLRQIVAPAGKHRPKRPMLLPDQPFATPTEPIRHAPRNEAELEQLFDDGVLAANAYATCLAEGRRRFHSFDRMGVRRCWTCGAQAAGDVLGPAATVRGDS